jgi:hypothetical protein
MFIANGRASACPSTGSVNVELEKAAASCRELLDCNRAAVEQVARRILQASRIGGGADPSGTGRDRAGLRRSP